jgi:2-haloacid dehalogenase
MDKLPLSPAPEAVLFDAYGTLFDVYSVALAAEQLFAGQGQALALAWRDKQIDYTRLLSMSGRYQPFWDITRAGLRHAAARLGLALDAAGEERLMNQYRHLSAFPENRDVLLALRERGIRAGILSNGDPQMLDVAIKSAGLSDLINPVLSAHSVQCFKTDARVYQLGPDALGLPARKILFVSSNGWDALGATWFGYSTLWVNRSGQPPEALEPAPCRTATNLRAVLDCLPA